MTLISLGSMAEQQHEHEHHWDDATKMLSRQQFLTQSIDRQTRIVMCVQNTSDQTISISVMLCLKLHWTWNSICQRQQNKLSSLVRIRSTYATMAWQRECVGKDATWDYWDCLESLNWHIWDVSEQVFLHVYRRQATVKCTLTSKLTTKCESFIEYFQHAVGFVIIIVFPLPV